MIYNSDDIPTQRMSDLISDITEEIKAAVEWFESTGTNFELIVESTKRPLTKDEAQKIASDFMMAGLLMTSMLARNTKIAEAGNSVISDITIEKLEALLKDA